LRYITTVSSPQSVSRLELQDRPDNVNLRQSVPKSGSSLHTNNTRNELPYFYIYVTVVYVTVAVQHCCIHMHVDIALVGAVELSPLCTLMKQIMTLL
jgi:hypothetical protein